MTLQDTIKQYYESLQTIYSLSEAKAITRIVVEDVTGFSSLDQHLKGHKILPDEQYITLANYLKRLLTHEPMQHVIGYEVFCGLRFKTNSSVLIPRPETEDLVQWIVASEKKDVRILDIGTGSGCIALSLKYLMPQSQVDAVELSAAALTIANENARNLNLEVDFSLLDILSENILKTYEVIVSNPPYIGLDEKEMMFPNVLKYEPSMALFSERPLQFYEVIADKAKHSLMPGGKLYFELNEFYAQDVKTMLEQKGYEAVEIRKDFADKDRMARAIWQG